MRELEKTGKTVEEAVLAACAELGVDRDDLNVTYDVLELPAKKLFKTIPARVVVRVEEPEAAPVAPAVPEAPAPVEKAAPAPEAPAAAAPKAAAEKPTSNFSAEEVPLDIAADARLTAAVEYLKPIFELMGVENATFAAARKGEATILHVDGDHVGALIGRRGETMESLSYLASLVVNRMEGDYVKLGLDVAGYRNKREDDLAALTKRICEKVKETGYYHEMEPMNPYERHIIHTAVSELDGVRSESKGEGQDRRVVIYSTDPDACNLPDRDSSRGPRRQGGQNRGGFNRGGRDGNRGRNGGGQNRGGFNRGSRDGNRSGSTGNRGYGHGGPRPSSVPTREFAEAPRDLTQAPQAPSRTERIHDDTDDFALFGKIEL